MGRPRNPFRDDEVVGMVAAGRTVLEIAYHYGLSRSTVWRLIETLRAMGRIPAVAVFACRQEEYQALCPSDHEVWTPAPERPPETTRPPPLDGPRPHYHHEGGFSMAAVRADDPFREIRIDSRAHGSRGRL